MRIFRYWLGFNFAYIEAFTATWSKYYCTYKKQQKQFTMLSYNQISGRTETEPESLTLVQCTRRASDFEKRYCFDLTFEQKPNITLTFQALSEEDRKVWLNAMDGKEPVSIINIIFATRVQWKLKTLFGDFVYWQFVYDAHVRTYSLNVQDVKSGNIDWPFGKYNVLRNRS